HDHARGRISVNYRYFLAFNPKTGNRRAGSDQYQPHCNHHVSRGRYHGRLNPALAGHAQASTDYTDSRSSIRDLSPSTLRVSLKKLCNLWIIRVFVKLTRHFL